MNILYMNVLFGLSPWIDWNTTFKKIKLDKADNQYIKEIDQDIFDFIKQNNITVIIPTSSYLHMKFLADNKDKLQKNYLIRQQVKIYQIHEKEKFG